MGQKDVEGCDAIIYAFHSTPREGTLKIPVSSPLEMLELR